VTSAPLLVTAFDAWNRNDLDGWLELLAGEIEISTSGVFPDLAPSYRGHAGAARFWDQMHAPWAEFRIELEHAEQGEGFEAAAIRFRGRGADSGVEVEMRFATAIAVRDDLATKLVNRRTLEEARKALPPPGRRAAPSRS
jgi:ketosteroid isomerase-like protein